MRRHYPWQVFLMFVHIRTRFRFALIAGNLTAQVTPQGEPQGNWRYNSISRDVVAHSPSFFPPRRQSAPKSLLAGYVHKAHRGTEILKKIYCFCYQVVQIRKRCKSISCKEHLLHDLGRAFYSHQKCFWH